MTTLSCRVVGRPPLTVLWYREGRVLLGDRYSVNFDPETGTVRLRIADLCPLDTGVYVCEASNCLGSTSTSLFLTVRG